MEHPGIPRTVLGLVVAASTALRWLTQLAAGRGPVTVRLICKIQISRRAPARHVLSCHRRCALAVDETLRGGERCGAERA
jgi:hypothetical protein